MANSPSKTVAPRKTEGGVLVKIMAGEVAFPEELGGLIDFVGWATSLVNKVKYKEPNPDYLSTLLLMQTLTSDTINDVFTQNQMDGLQKVIPNVPAGSTGPIDIIDLYVTQSDQEDGNPTYMILGIRDLDTGREWRTTTGATQVQAQILTLIALGQWPVRCRIIRLDRKDRGGRYLMWVAPPDEN